MHSKLRLGVWDTTSDPTQYQQVKEQVAQSQAVLMMYDPANPSQDFMHLDGPQDDQLRYLVATTKASQSFSACQKILD